MFFQITDDKPAEEHAISQTELEIAGWWALKTGK